MARFTLWIGNKNYSTWSMRAWLLAQHFDLPFEEKLIPFDDFSEQGSFKQHIYTVNPTGKVPCVVDDEVVVWDTLAIAEYFAESFPEKALWPQDRAQRAWARSVTAEMHSGFSSLRQLCPMNIEADLAHIGHQLWKEHAGLRADLQRIEDIWSRRDTSSAFLCGDFGIIDAFYVPVVFRILCFDLPVSAFSREYMNHVLQLPAVQAWVNAALQEKTFVAVDEPYRQHREEYLAAAYF